MGWRARVRGDEEEEKKGCRRRATSDRLGKKGVQVEARPLLLRARGWLHAVRKALVKGPRPLDRDGRNYEAKKAGSRGENRRGKGGSEAARTGLHVGGGSGLAHPEETQ